MKKNEIISGQTKKIRKITITSCLLSISLLLSFITNFIKISFLGSFLTLDLSMVFIIPLIFICGFYSAFFSATIVGLFSFFWSDSSWVGALINIFVNIVVVIVIKVISIFILRKTNFVWIRLIIVFTLSLFFICLIVSFFNAIFFQPLYWWLFGYIQSPSFIEASNKYNSEPNIFLLFIDEYWKGTFALYTIFNSIKFFIVFFITLCPLHIIIKHKLAQKYFYTFN